MTDDQFFPTKKEAFTWYAENGGQRKRASFYEHVPATGRQVARFTVSEMLRIEGGGRDEYVEDSRARLIKAQADKMEFENAVKQGKYLEREAEEQRDAAVLAALRRHIESAAPDRLQNILARISEQVDEKTRSKMIAIQPDWLASDMDFIDQMFDQFIGAP